MLLFGFVVFILHASIFCFRFPQKKVQTSQKKIRGMAFYLTEKHMQKLKKKKEKQNVPPFCTKPFNYAK